MKATLHFARIAYEGRLLNLWSPPTAELGQHGLQWYNSAGQMFPLCNAMNISALYIKIAGDKMCPKHIWVYDVVIPLVPMGAMQCSHLHGSWLQLWQWGRVVSPCPMLVKPFVQ